MNFGKNISSPFCLCWSCAISNIIFKEHFLGLVLDKNIENKTEDEGGNRTVSQQKSKKKQFWEQRPHDVEEWSQSQHDFVSGKLILSMLAQSFWPSNRLLRSIFWPEIITILRISSTRANFIILINSRIFPRPRHRDITGHCSGICWHIWEFTSVTCRYVQNVPNPVNGAADSDRLERRRSPVRRR